MKKLNFKSALFIVGLALFSFASCKKEEIEPKPTNPPSAGTEPAIILDCNFFNEDRVLVDNPEAPVDYIINCKMRISADIIIEPGVVIEFEQNAGIDVDDFNIANASLSAVGTAEKPIVFRGVKKEAGYWRGIMFDSNSPMNNLTHVRIEDGGGQAFNSNGDRGGVIVYSGAQLKMNNSKVTNSQTYGFNAVYTNTNSVTLNNNTFTENDGPAYVCPNILDALNGTNSFKGNTDDYIRVYTNAAYINKPSTWHKADVKYRTNGGFDVGGGLLTIQPGVKIEFAQESKLKIGETGGLKAVGTAEEPIIFSGISKVPKGWKGIYLHSKHAENEIAFAEIEYSGIGSPQGNVWLWYNSILNIHDVTFSNIHGCGINYRSPSAGEEDNLTIGANIIVDSGGCESSVW